MKFLDTFSILFIYVFLFLFALYQIGDNSIKSLLEFLKDYCPLLVFLTSVFTVIAYRSSQESVSDDRDQSYDNPNTEDSFDRKDKAREIIDDLLDLGETKDRSSYSLAIKGSWGLFYRSQSFETFVHDYMRFYIVRQKWGSLVNNVRHSELISLLDFRLIK